MFIILSWFVNLYYIRSCLYVTTLFDNVSEVLQNFEFTIKLQVSGVCSKRGCKKHLKMLTRQNLFSRFDGKGTSGFKTKRNTIVQFVMIQYKNQIAFKPSNCVHVYHKNASMNGLKGLKYVCTDMPYV